MSDYSSNLGPLLKAADKYMQTRSSHGLFFRKSKVNQTFQLFCRLYEQAMQIKAGQPELHDLDAAITRSQFCPEIGDRFEALKLYFLRRVDITMFNSVLGKICGRREKREDLPIHDCGTEEDMQSALVLFCRTMRFLRRSDIPKEHLERSIQFYLQLEGLDKHHEQLFDTLRSEIESSISE